MFSSLHVVASHPDFLTAVALRLRAADRSALAMVLARSVAVGDPPRPAPRFPELTLRQARAAAGLLLIIALGLSANYLGRRYTCAEGMIAAKQATIAGFALLGIAVHRVAHLGTLVAADALRLALPDRRRLADTLGRSLAAGETTRAGGRRALAPMQVAIATALVVVLPALGAADYGLRPHACAGGVGDAAHRIMLLSIASALACAIYVRGALRDWRVVVPGAAESNASEGHVFPGVVARARVDHEARVAPPNEALKLTNRPDDPR